jgi:SARP family transcriptional regulator, regulator of embCAB operon
MDFRLLGPFEARHDGVVVTVAKRRQERCLLALLLLQPDRMLSIERIAELLWEGAPPATARGTVHTYVGRLRRTLDPYGVQIVTRGDGYVLESGAHTVDVEDFTTLVRDAAEVNDPADRLRRYDLAMDLWRGPLLADTIDDVLRERLGTHLSEARLATAELRAEAQLTMGLHDRVLDDLAPLQAAHPTRERLVGSLMTALYRGGRQAEALSLFRTTRGLLIDSLGVDPGRELQQLHERMLRSDPRLERPVAPVFAVRVRDQWLPWNTSGHPALEFCNTYAGWRVPPLPGGEWLRSYATLAVWAGYHDLADDWTVTRLVRMAERDPVPAAEVLASARDLRTHLYACLTDPDDHDAFAAVARYIEAAGTAATFRLGEDGLGHWGVDPAAGLTLPVHAVARVAADLLADPRRFTLQACSSPECGWLFLDRSGMRRFCSVATCGKHEGETHIGAADQSRSA